MVYEFRILIILLYFQNYQAELILENQQTWKEEYSDLKESLKTMKKRYGTYGRNVS
jgi:hypothetical protein